MSHDLPSSIVAFPGPSGASVEQESARFGAALVALAGTLRRRAYRLTRDIVQAEDLMQEAMTRAWAARRSFRPGSDLRAWTFTILRNLFLSQMRRSARTVELSDLASDNLVSPDADQHQRAELNAVLVAIGSLPTGHQVVLRAVAIDGYDYKTAAAMLDLTQSALKSRVRRARIALVGMLERERPRRPPQVAQSNLEATIPLAKARNGKSRRAPDALKRPLWIGLRDGQTKTANRCRAP